jgi:hypothetical protein
LGADPVSSIAAFSYTKLAAVATGCFRFAAITGRPYSG